MNHSSGTFTFMLVAREIFNRDNIKQELCHEKIPPEMKIALRYKPLYTDSEQNAF